MRKLIILHFGVGLSVGIRQFSASSRACCLQRLRRAAESMREELLSQDVQDGIRYLHEIVQAENEI